MKIIDLTHGIDEQFPIYPTDPGLEFVNHCTYSDYGYNVNKISLGIHTGTHVDAPSHRLANGLTVDKTPLSSYVCKVLVIDLTDMEIKKEIEIENLSKYEEKIRAIGALVIRTDWGKNIASDDYFTGYGGVSKECAKWLVSLGVRTIGVETPSINSANHAVVHDVFFESGAVIIENLVNLCDIKSETVFLSAAPLKLNGLEGSPVRAYAIEE